MNVSEQLDLLLIAKRTMLRTDFLTVTIPATALKRGLPIGDGKCLAVVLYLNSLAHNTVTNTATAANLAQIYYGDARSQERELIRGQQSDIIFCKDLSEVYVRGNGVENHIQVLIYLNDEVE